jgi:hypothetical protein
MWVLVCFPSFFFQKLFFFFKNYSSSLFYLYYFGWKQRGGAVNTFHSEIIKNTIKNHIHIWWLDCVALRTFRLEAKVEAQGILGHLSWGGQQYVEGYLSIHVTREADRGTEPEWISILPFAHTVRQTPASLRKVQPCDQVLSSTSQHEQTFVGGKIQSCQLHPSIFFEDLT